ncbi:hypothetical protein SLS55_010391 [Diplodia seriata]|uniref:Small secreted protein n=1 Tax=Diplodia seriata TaxID=420778 RepID=A0ABR3BYC8_9PEZI
MKFSASTITAIVLSLSASAVAAPTSDAPLNPLEKRVDCVAKAAMVHKWWVEYPYRRYRIAFSITRPDIDPDQLGDSCSDFGGDALAKCSAIDGDVSCYYSAADQSWFIDNNQSAKFGIVVVGDWIEDCMILAFRDKLAARWGCHL